MRLKLKPKDLSEALSVINPLTPPAARQRKSAAPWGAVIAADEQPTLFTDQWGDPPRPAAKTEFAARIIEPGEPRRLLDSRAAQTAIKTHFRGRMTETAVLTANRETVSLDGLKLPAAPHSRPFKSGGGAELRMDAQRLQNLVRRLLPLCGRDANRPSLMTFQMRVKPGERTRVAATDMFRLAVERLDAEHLPPPGEYLIGGSLMAAAARFRTEGECSLRWENGFEFVNIGKLRMRLRFSGLFSAPNLDQLLRKWERAGNVVILLRPADVADAIKSVPHPEDAKPGNVPIRIRWGNGTMTAAYRDGEPVKVGETKSDIEAHSSYNPLFLESVLRAVPEGARQAKLRIWADDDGVARSPLHLTANSGHRSLLMPVVMPRSEPV